MHLFNILSLQEVVELAGYTARVATMVEVFEDCSVGKYRRNIVTTTKGKKTSSDSAIGERKELEFKDGSPVIKGVVTEAADGTIIVENVRICNTNSLVYEKVTYCYHCKCFTPGSDCDTQLRYCRT